MLHSTNKIIKHKTAVLENCIVRTPISFRPEGQAAHPKGRFSQIHGAYLRVHRSISWVDRAEAELDDHDARFLFLWIAFNAAMLTRWDC